MLTLRPNPDPNAPQSEPQNLPPGDAAPALGAPKQILSQGFFANLKDFLTERPVKVSRAARGGAFALADFRSGFMENLKDAFHRGPKVYGPEASLRGENAPGIKVEYQPFYRILLQNVRDLISPPKLPPLEVTSEPVAVKEIWSKDELFSRAQIISAIVHVAVGVLLIVPILRVATTAVKAVNKTQIIVTPVDISPYQSKLPPAKKIAQGGGGGGEHNPIPASRGMLPKFSMGPQLAPPAIPRNPHPALQVTPTLIGPDQLKVPNISADRWGDPLAKMVTDSNGPGASGGMGSGSGGGIGSGTGGGLGPGQGGGTGGGIFNAGTGGVGNPECVYCPRPDYSDEARKAKYQGDVLLSVVVLPSGKASDIEVIKSPGMGLDTKAIEAVRTWQFKPANGKDGKPVAARVQVIVTFQLF
jgi:periplasmic protein TonB